MPEKPTPVRLRLGEIVQQHGWISAEQLKEALARQKADQRPLGAILVEMGLQRQQVAQALAEQRRHVVEVRPEDLKDLPPDVIALVPETLARRFNCIPIRKVDQFTLALVMENPRDMEAINLVAHVAKCDIEPMRASAKEIAGAIDLHYGSELKQVAQGGAESLEAVTLQVESADTAAEQDLAETELMASAEETPVVKFVEVLFREAVNKRASDVHIEPDEQTSNVRLRIDGVLQRLLTISVRMHPAVVSRIKILSGLDIAERRLPQDGRCRLKSNDREVEVRVSTLPTVHGEKVVMRMLDKSRVIQSLDNLGFGEFDLGRFKEALRASYGMVLLSGPTGSGKTTTLYGGLNMLNESTKSIVTVEDPVEYQLPGICQVPVRPDIGLTFALCLRHILRQDPNVIMIGEMRDLETTQIAVRAALTGHLVLSTLHANNAPAVVSRLVDIGIEHFLITATLNMALAQRLVRRLCAECKEAFTPPEHAIRDLGGPEATAKASFFKPTGCEKCDYTGYFGRVGLYEVMPMGARIKRMILEGATEADLRATARSEGMKTLYEQGVSKVIEGTTSMEEILSLPAEEGGS